MTHVTLNMQCTYTIRRQRPTVSDGGWQWWR